MTSTLCRACGAPVTRSFVDLGMSPLANSFVPLDRAEVGETFYPLHAKVCEACQLVQLAQFEAPKKIFSDDYAYFSSYSSSWLAHAERYCAAMTARFGLGAEAHVAEVASNDGYLLNFFVRDGRRVTGIEPAANCAEAAEAKGVHTERLFFSTSTGRDIAQRRGQAALIAANNVLAHVPDIHDFLGGFRELLLPEGVATFEFPHVLSLMRHNQFDTIYHEHFSYLALGPVEKVLAAQRLRVFDVERLPTHGGSLRLFVCHEGATHTQTPAVAALAAEEQAEGLNDLARYDAFAPRVVAIKCAVLEFLIAARREGKTVAAYGAAAKGNTLLNYCGVGPEFIAFAVDRNPVKQNTLLPGTRIPVFGVEAVAERKPDYLMILPWNLREEVAQQMHEIRAWGGRFVTAIPDVEVF
jgi:hypothetical protein